MTGLMTSEATDRVAAPRRRVRMPLLAAAVGLVLAATLLVLWGFSKAADRTEVLMVDRPIAAGEPIPADALTTTMIGTDGGVGRFYPAGTDVSGVVAAADLEAGDLLTPALLLAATDVPDGWREVGVVLRQGRYPTTVVDGDSMVAIPSEGPGEVDVIVIDASVGDDGALSAVIAVPPDQAAQVSQWAIGEQLGLVRIP